MNTPVISSWRELVAYIISAILVPFLVQYLRSHAQAAQAAAEKSKVDKQATIMDRLREFAFTAAADISEKNFPILAHNIKNGTLKSKEDVHVMLKQWGNDLYQEAVTHFDQQDINLVKEVGDQAIVRLIESAANAASPFPGMVTSEAVMQPGVPDMLITRGVEYVKSFTPELMCQACIPPCDTCPLKIKENKS